MNAVATRPRVAKAKPAHVTSPVENILARIDTVLVQLTRALDAAEEGSDLAVLIFGIIDTLIPLAVPPLYRAPVSKTDVDEAYRELFLPLSVLKAALMISEGLVIESTLQQAFDILDGAHSDMDSARVQHWPIPDGTETFSKPDEELPVPAKTKSPLADSLQLWREAMVTAELSTGDEGGDVLRGAVALMELAEKEIEAAVTIADGDDASLAMCYGLAVLRSAQGGKNDNCELGISAAISLASLAKDALDSATTELPQEVNHA